MSRYKVWTRDPDGQPGTLLLRTGSAERLDHDIGDFTGTPAEVAVRACGQGFAGAVLVKNFDDGLCYTVHVGESVVVEEGWR